MSQVNYRKILLVEDDEITQRIHIYFLKKLGFEIELVSTGYAALEKLGLVTHEDKKLTLQRNCKTDYFAVILDLGLPDIDGEIVLSSLRTQENETGGHLPVIIVTAHGDPAILCHYKEAKKADDGFTKPVTFLDFKQALQKLEFSRQSNEDETI